LSPPVCARERLAPRNNVITNVNIFFIQFSESNFYWGPWTCLTPDAAGSCCLFQPTSQ
jgi:hypothetical protein